LWNLAHPGVRRVAALIGPRVFGIGIVQIDVLIGTQFASYMAEGSVASIGLADRVMELVLGGYVIALSTAVLPLLARQAAVDDMHDMKHTLCFAMRLALFVTLPATVGLILLRRPIIEVLFQSGKFDAQSTSLTAWALMFFAVGLSAFSMVKIVVQAFYVLHDTWTPVVIGLGSLVINIVCNFVFFPVLANGGPALATSLAAFFDTVTLLIIFRLRYGSVGIRQVLRSSTKFVIASILMGILTYAFIRIPGLYEGSWAQKATALTVAILLATAAYVGCARLLRARELQEMGGIFGHHSV
jgi:putative peptidoglycan lipid II flippase